MKSFFIKSKVFKFKKSFYLADFKLFAVFSDINIYYEKKIIFNKLLDNATYIFLQINKKCDKSTLLPDKINNPNLNLTIAYHNKQYLFPENWKINILRFHDSTKLPIIPKSFITKEIIYTKKQKICQQKKLQKNILMKN